MAELAVKIDHVSKYFRLPTEASTNLRTTLVNRFRGIKGYKEQHVLKDIDFEVEKGDFLELLDVTVQENQHFKNHFANLCSRKRNSDRKW